MSRKTENIHERYIPPSTRELLLKSIWKVDNPGTQGRSSEALIQYCVDQCASSLPQYTDENIILTHQDLLAAIHILADPGISRENVVAAARRRFSPRSSNHAEERLYEVVDLAARIALMIDIGAGGIYFTPDQKPLPWNNGMLKELVYARFRGPANAQSRIVRVKLEKLFTTHNLEGIAGI